MPELPEVQTVIDGLNQKILNKRIESIVEHRDGTVFWHTGRSDLGNVEVISRAGKYIIINTSENFKIVIHLRMTGKLIFEVDYNFRTKHTRAEIIFSDGTKVNFNDIRTFGKMEIYKSNSIIKALENLGVEPLSENYNKSYLIQKLKSKKAPIKNILLDQWIVAGLGNIYVCEILFRAGIDPRSEGKKLKQKQVKDIVLHTKEVLQEALKHNGTTISDYRNVDDKTGEFQNFLKVYGKKVCECGEGIERIKQAGRSTFYCPRCQVG